MGRTSRAIPQGKYILRTPKIVDKNKAYPIYLYYYCGNKQIRESTSITAKIGEWNSNTGELRASCGHDYKKKNAYLHGLIRKVDANIFSYVEQNGRIKPEVIKSFIAGDTKALRVDKGINFITFARECVQQRYDNHRISCSTYFNHITNINQFVMYLKLNKKESMFVDCISKDIIEEFVDWSLKRKRKEDTVIKYLQTLSIVCGCAEQLGYISKEKAYCIKNISVPSVNMDDRKTTVRYLTEDEMRRLSEVNRSSITKRQAEVLDIFLFSFHACGLRISDIITLKWEHIDMTAKSICKVQMKTSKRNKVYLDEVSLQILNNWKGKHEVSVFGLLPDNFDLNNAEEFRIKRNSITSTFNKCLEKLARVAGIDKKVTFHYARHTWAVLALARGKEIGVISTLLGHSSTAITEKVYAEYLPDTLFETVDSLKFDF